MAMAADWAHSMGP